VRLKVKVADIFRSMVILMVVCEKNIGAFLEKLVSHENKE
jgi:hypothetical protein